MLLLLRQIIQDLNSAQRLDEALKIILTGVKKVFAVDAVSVYLAEGKEDERQLVLRATDGLKPRAIGKVRMAVGEGLVGQVAKTAEPINTDDVHQHPLFKYFPDSGEAVFASFLGVPIIHFGRLAGVLVVQQKEKRLFDEEKISFLMTLAAQIAGGLSRPAFSEETPAMWRKLLGNEPQRVVGVAGAGGIAIGVAVVILDEMPLEQVPDKSCDDPKSEVAKFERACQDCRAYNLQTRAAMAQSLGKEELAIFDVYDMLLAGGSLITDTIAHIEAGNWAEGALRKTIDKHVKIFMAMDDAYLGQRAADLKDIGTQVLSFLRAGKPQKRSEWPQNTILVGANLAISQFAQVPADKLAGVVSLAGSSTSHLAIVANSMGVPAVMGLGDSALLALEGRELIVDGDSGLIYIDPSWSLKREYSRLIKQQKETSQALLSLIDAKATTLDGSDCVLYVNTGLLSDMAPSLRVGAEGIGLYRTEIPFQVRNRFPSEDEQFNIYQKVLHSFAGKPVVMRTLDIGGDKPLDYFPIQETNPFLGWRGIRVTLDQPELYLAQLRAMLRADGGSGNLRILLPMVSSAAEIVSARKLIYQARDELIAAGIAQAKVRVGVMLEVPSLLFTMENIGAHVDFFSVGSNDLTQYLLAVDRNNERVAKLYSPLHPAVLRALKMAVESADKMGKPISICGEMAGDPASLLCLLGMGYRIFSMNASKILLAKKLIRSVDIGSCQQLLQAVLAAKSRSSAKQLVADKLQQLGVGRQRHG